MIVWLCGLRGSNHTGSLLVQTVFTFICALAWGKRKALCHLHFSSMLPSYQPLCKLRSCCDKSLLLFSTPKDSRQGRFVCTKIMQDKSSSSLSGLCGQTLPLSKELWHCSLDLRLPINTFTSVRCSVLYDAIRRTHGEKNMHRCVYYTEK